MGFSSSAPEKSNRIIQNTIITDLVQARRSNKNYTSEADFSIALLYLATRFVAPSEDDVHLNTITTMKFGDKKASRILLEKLKSDEAFFIIASYAISYVCSCCEENDLKGENAVWAASKILIGLVDEKKSNLYNKSLDKIIAMHKGLRVKISIDFSNTEFGRVTQKQIDEFVATKICKELNIDTDILKMDFAIVYMFVAIWSKSFLPTLKEIYEDYAKYSSDVSP